MKSNIQNKKINDETITVSRTDYEELQHQVAQLKAQLDVDGDDKDTVTILSSEYEQMKQWKYLGTKQQHQRDSVTVRHYLQ